MTETAKLKPCPKCKGEDISTAFHLGDFISSRGCGYAPNNTQQGEHLHYTCRNCGYDWTGNCEDREEQP